MARGARWGGSVVLKTRPSFPFLLLLCFLMTSSFHLTCSETSRSPHFAGPVTPGWHLSVETVTRQLPASWVSSWLRVSLVGKTRVGEFQGQRRLGRPHWEARLSGTGVSPGRRFPSGTHLDSVQLCVGPSCKSLTSCRPQASGKRPT